VTYLRLSGAKALARSANREAAIHYGEALEALGHLPESRANLEQAVDIRFDIRGAITPLGQLREAFEVLHEAEGAAERLGDERRLAQLWALLSNNCWATGRLAEARTLSLRARPLAETLGDPGLQAHANINLGLVAFFSGDYRLAERHFRENVGLLTFELARQRFGHALFPAVNSRVLLARTLANLGAFDEGIEHGQVAMALAEEVGHPYSLTIACWGLGEVYAIQGDVAGAVSMLGRGLSLARELTLRFATPLLASTLGVVYAQFGRVADGLPLLRDAQADVEAIGLSIYEALILLRLAEALGRAGQVDEARDAVTRALILARHRTERGHEAEALRLLGELAIGTGSAVGGNAEVHFRTALALADELGMRPLMAHCHLGLGKLYRRTGDPPKAEEHLTTATAMYREMDMRFWLEQAEAELAGP
jgi:tetratricopeptide (TPR) repeat protein